MKDFIEFTIFRDDRLPLSFIKNALEKTNLSFGVPLAFQEDPGQLLLYHPNHLTDYFYLKIELLFRGSADALRISFCGESKQTAEADAVEAVRRGSEKPDFCDQLTFGSPSYLHFRTDPRFPCFADPNRRAQTEELRYYVSLFRLIKKALCAF